MYTTDYVKLLVAVMKPKSYNFLSSHQLLLLEVAAHLSIVMHITESQRVKELCCFCSIRIPKHECQEELSGLEEKIVKRKSQFRELEDVLPHENG